MNGSLYFLAVYLLNKKNKKEAIFFATHPLIIIEGIINAHNDMIAISLGLIGVYLLEKKYHIWSRIFFLLSVGIKYITAPILGLGFVKQNKLYLKFLFIAQISLILYLCFKMEIQPWYFLSLFVFLPYFRGFIEKFSILFAGLLLSYYPFIRFGDWTAKTVFMKREIVSIFFILNCIYLGIVFFYERKKKIHA